MNDLPEDHFSSFKYYDDDGNELNPDLVRKPALACPVRRTRSRGRAGSLQSQPPRPEGRPRVQMLCLRTEGKEIDP
jgi:hypothetical protein